jgi:hypothetical protein
MLVITRVDYPIGRRTDLQGEFRSPGTDWPGGAQREAVRDVLTDRTRGSAPDPGVLEACAATSACAPEDASFAWWVKSRVTRPQNPRANRIGSAGSSAWTSKSRTEPSDRNGTPRRPAYLSLDGLLPSIAHRRFSRRGGSSTPLPSPVNRRRFFVTLKLLGSICDSAL